MSSTFGIAADLLSLETTGVHLVDLGGPSESSQNATCPDSDGSVVEETVYGLKHLLDPTYRVDRGASLTPANIGSLVATDYLLLGGSARFSLSGETGVLVSFKLRDVPAGFTATREFDTGLVIPGGPGIPAYLYTVVTGNVTALTIDFGTSDFDGLSKVGDVAAVEVAACRISVTVEMQQCDGTPSLTWAAGYTDEFKDQPTQTNSGYPVYTFQAFKNVVAS